MTRTTAALAALLLLATASAIRAQTTRDPAAAPQVNDKTQIFCRDNTGTPVL